MPYQLTVGNTEESGFIHIVDLDDKNRFCRMDGLTAPQLVEMATAALAAANRLEGGGKAQPLVNVVSGA